MCGCYIQLIFVRYLCFTWVCLLWCHRSLITVKAEHNNHGTEPRNRTELDRPYRNERISVRSSVHHFSHIWSVVRSGLILGRTKPTNRMGTDRLGPNSSDHRSGFLGRISYQSPPVFRQCSTLNR